MLRREVGCAMLLCLQAFVSPSAWGQTSFDFLEVATVTPSRLIRHDVDLKGPFDDRKLETSLIGPAYFSQAVGLNGTAVKGPKAYLNWYKISRPFKEPQRYVSVAGSLQGDEAQRITIQDSAFLLSPAQKLTTGTPDSVPDKLNFFKAFRIVKAQPMSQSLKLTGALGPDQRTATKAVFLCLPVEEWHHDEHFPIKRGSDCFLVYELEPRRIDVQTTTIDQFGINKLKCESSRWFCYGAKILDSADTK